ncbi:glycosyltransferase family 32 protein [Allorhizobium undicola]|uniref:glycosyltransferase family 32 protein n=1 Tax=Allorhizobium undicola TaxID=78527 RepID=UPI000AACD8AC|nr:glycosyltransferase [Allorhizobium undicola]
MNDMQKPREKLRAILEQAVGLAQAGQHGDALALLERLAADRELLEKGEPGPLTALGEPRKLHSTRLKLAKLRRDMREIAALQYLLVPHPAVLADLATFHEGSRNAMTDINRQPVPRVVHQIWLGDLPLPPATAAWQAHCKSHGFEWRLWREADLARQGFDRHPSFQAMLARGDYPGAVDVARYLILSQQGGVYLDCDWYPARDGASLADCHPLIGLSALPEDTPRLTGFGPLLLTNSFIASPPGHLVFTRLLEAMPQAMARLPDAPAWWSTGPLLFTLILRSTTVTLPDCTLVAANLPRRAPFSAVEEARKQADRVARGFLIGWKSW